LEGTLEAVKVKLKEKEKTNESKFRQQCRIIRDLRTQLEQVRETEKQRQNELMDMRKMCASVSRKISARTNEAASMKRHLAMLDKDNEELRVEIVKLEAQLFPQVFKTGKL
jgi:chromosome segregation ATPase